MKPESGSGDKTIESDAVNPPGKWKRWVKRLVVAIVVLLIISVVLVFTIPRWITGESHEAFTLDDASPNGANEVRVEPTLTVMTANIAHGRGTSRHQMFLSKAAIVGNLDDVATVFKRERPDVIALQEADGPSIWSGRFHHVKYLARNAGYRHGLRGKNVDGLGLTYGPAILSRRPLFEPSSVTFAPSPPTMSKGFVSARVTWPGRKSVKVTIVSVHLDFARAKVRSRQIARMRAELATVNRPLIVVGDFNCEWNDQESSLRTLVQELGLYCYRPEAKGLATFPDSDQRIDWILISDDLAFEKYKTLGDSVSDHRFVIATVRLKTAIQAQTRRQD